jgi:hypothetical protein
MPPNLHGFEGMNVGKDNDDEDDVNVEDGDGVEGMPHEEGAADVETMSI